MQVVQSVTDGMETEFGRGRAVRPALLSVIGAGTRDPGSERGLDVRGPPLRPRSAARLATSPAPIMDGTGWTCW